jgi:CBS domain-containing protein
MATTVAEIMTRDPEAVQADMTVTEAARHMRASDTGDVVVLDADRLLGILTDRDITVRAVAEDKGPATAVREVCSGEDLVTVTADTPVEQAVELMRSRAVRRLPVVDGERVIG